MPYTANSDENWINLLRLLNPDENWALFSKLHNATERPMNPYMAEELTQIAADLTEADLINADHAE